jgi:sugar phosphate isomerase/epimerase
MSELNQIGYANTISIEHEDADYEQNLDAVKEGLILGRQHLKKFM